MNGKEEWKERNAPVMQDAFGEAGAPPELEEFEKELAAGIDAGDPELTTEVFDGKTWRVVQSPSDD